MEKLKASIEIMRPVNGIGAVIGVIVGAIASGFHLFIDRYFIAVLISFLAAFLTASAGHTLNDWKDVEIDRINCPERAIPSGRISRNTALVLTIIFFIVGDIIIFFTKNLQAIMIVLIGSVLIALYSLELKRLGFIGNITIGILTSFCLLLGGAVLNKIEYSFWAALLAFVMNIGREITKGVDDFVGDKEEGIKTLAVLFGKKKASYIAIIFLIGTIILSPLPYIFKLYNELYLLLAVGGVDSIMIISIILLLKNPESSDNAHFIKRILKFGMFIGLIAFLVGFPSLILPDPDPFKIVIWKITDVLFL